MDTALTVIVVVGVVALAAAAAAAFYSWSRRNRAFEPSVRRTTVVEHPVAGEPPLARAGQVVKEERYTRTVARAPPPDAAFARGDDDTLGRPPL